MSALTKQGTPRKRNYPSVRATPGMAIVDRIALYVAEDEAGCWVWQGSKKNNGYGQLTIDGRPGQIAHRLAYEAYRVEIPEGLQLDHLCRNRGCVNPWHLEPVTALVNNHRGEGNASKTHCPAGHEYVETNVYHHGGRRYCRTCQRAQKAAWLARQNFADSA